MIAALSVLALTVSVALARPKVGGLRIHHGWAAVLGAALMLGLGILPLGLLWVTFRLLALPVVTIVSLMTITIVADRAGLIAIMARRIGRLAAGDARRLFTLIFICGTLVGAVFTNDAAILLFTPLVFTLIEEIQEPGWTLRHKIPFYFAVLYVGNLVGALVISNPINIVVSSIFHVAFLEYAKWMVAPALVSMIVSFVGLRIAFRRQLPVTCGLPKEHSIQPKDLAMVRLSCLVVGLTLLGFFSESVTGMPTWGVAAAGALTLLVATALRGGSPFQVVRGVAWDVIVFLVGMFTISMALRNVGVTHVLRDIISGIGGAGEDGFGLSTGLVAAVCSSILNNHPTAGLMIWVIQDLSQSFSEVKQLVFAALIGGDLGPKMLPIGSLAALMWFRILRDRGVEVPYKLYIAIGIPVTLAAVILSILTLDLEHWLVIGLGR